MFPNSRRCDYNITANINHISLYFNILNDEIFQNCGRATADSVNVRHRFSSLLYVLQTSGWLPYIWKPCQREWVIRIPDRYVFDGEVARKTMELGEMNLEVELEDENQECIHH
ncbi:hypothetical protein ACH3XW_45255 [Acanthocheilonema viteae]